MASSDHWSCKASYNLLQYNHHHHSAAAQQYQTQQQRSQINGSNSIAHVKNCNYKQQQLPLWRAVILFSACAIALIMTLTIYLGFLPSFRHYFHVNYYYRTTTLTSVPKHDQDYANNSVVQLHTAFAPAPTKHSYRTSSNSQLIIPAGEGQDVLVSATDVHPLQENQPMESTQPERLAGINNIQVEGSLRHNNNKSKSTDSSPPLDVQSSSSFSVASIVRQTGFNGNANSSSVSTSSCDLFRGKWVHEADLQGPYYNDTSCPILTQSQNCRGNGRPDQDYEKWRWRPYGCELPLFDGREFLRLMEGKTIGFVGDSVARNQMESLMCILWQVEVPVNRGSRKMQKWLFRSHKVTVIRIWSAWLVRTNHDSEEDVTKLYLEEADPNFMEFLPRMDVLVVSSGHWFTKRSAYVMGASTQEDVVGGQLWKPSRNSKLITTATKSNTWMKNPQAFAIAMKTALGGIVNSGYSGVAILRTYSPDHYEGGTWNTGGSCTGKTRPLTSKEVARNPYTELLYSHQQRAFQKLYRNSNHTKLRLLDITPVFAYRADGHPGPYRNRDPNKITRRGPRGQPPSQDCLHWCMPGPVDTWNELLLQMLKHEFNFTS